MSACPTRRRAPLHGSGGFTLVELMVGIGISMVIIAAAAAMYITTAGIGRSNRQVSEIQSNGQQAMDALRRDILNAGFRGMTGDVDMLMPASTAVTNNCANGFAMNLRQAVWGANDSNPFSASCIPSANYLRGDVLAVRRLGIVSTGGLLSTRLYLRSSFPAGEFFVGSSPPASFAFSPWEDHLLDAAVYFISPFTVSASESPQVPALYRTRLVAGPAMSAPELVASGVDDLQVQFEVRRGGEVRLLDAGTAPLDAGSGTTTTSGWDEVSAVRVFLLARAQGGDGGFAPGSRTYTLGSREVTYTDNIPRQVMASVFSLRNR